MKKERERHILKLNKVFTRLVIGHEEGLFPHSGHTGMNELSMPKHQAAILKQSEEGALSHSS